MCTIAQLRIMVGKQLLIVPGDNGGILEFPGLRREDCSAPEELLLLSQFKFGRIIVDRPYR
jgi:hypothetical protein